MMLSEERKFDFNDLFVFEMANNHQGSVEHGCAIIRSMADVARAKGVRGAIKFQFRDLDSFIHPGFRENKEYKHIARFLSTRLTDEEFAHMVQEARTQNLLTASTPFDESSVDKIERMGVEVVKIASCSAHDWPLLERVAETGKPVICSVGGLTIPEIDRVVSFFQHRGVWFALMHCVAVYPTLSDRLELNQIEVMRNRYPGITIGFSTHEEPANLAAVRIAYAKGARIFEKHVGVPTDATPLNAYSANPEQVAAWIDAYAEARAACGTTGVRTISEQEYIDLRSLMRGVWAKKDIKVGTPIQRADVFFAMPLLANQLTSGMWREELIADQDYPAGGPLPSSLRLRERTKKEIVYSVIHAVKGMLHEARIPLGHDFSVELSHHYGIDRFHEAGCVLIDCFNREYAKKLIIQLPGQYHPIHYHRKKDETFHVLRGEMEVDIEGKKKKLVPGDTLWVPRGVWHGFQSDTGVIFEEVSTTSYPDDSFYIDRVIAKLERGDRKTRLLNWGRHQFDEIEIPPGGLV